jgi:hypothetical protein
VEFLDGEIIDLLLLIPLFCVSRIDISSGVGVILGARKSAGSHHSIIFPFGRFEEICKKVLPFSIFEVPL